MKLLDRIANLAVIVAVVIFLAIVFRGGYLRRGTTSTRSPAALVGRTINLSGMSFSPGQDTMILDISTACHFCTESLPFYKRLADVSRGKLSIIAVMPQPQTEAENYLKQAGITGVRVISANLSSIGVYATPTLMLVDSRGKVKTAWVGKQDDAGQVRILGSVPGQVHARMFKQ